MPGISPRKRTPRSNFAFTEETGCGVRPRLLVSIFNAEEVRGAANGGADIIDCEDPRVVMGMYPPHTVTQIAYAVRQNEGMRRLPMSVNIGAELTLFQSTGSPRADYETQARAAQQALGMAAAMDVGDQRTNIIKFGIAGIHAEKIPELVRAVKRATSDHPKYENHLVICGFAPFDWEEWDRRKSATNVVAELIRVGEIRVHAGGALRIGQFITSPQELQTLRLNADDNFDLSEPPKPATLGLPDDQMVRVKAYVDRIAEGGADGVMMDTPVQAKLARICLVKHPDNQQDTSGGTRPALHGIFEADELQKFANYCAFRGMESWLAGSITPYHARLLGKLDNLDVVLCRGVASEPVADPFGGQAQSSRLANRVTARRVAAMVKALEG